MNCNCCKEENQSVEVIGLCDPDSIVFNPCSEDDRNWTEISIPEVLTIPCKKPDVEQVEKVLVTVKIISKRVVETPFACGENAEGTRLTGFKLIVEGLLRQRIVYTAALEDQPVHSAHFEMPFSAFIVLPGKTCLEDEFCVDVCVEDVFVKVINKRDIFKNVTLFIRAKFAPPKPSCP